MTETTSPPIERVTVVIPPELVDRFESFIGKMGWTREEGVQILLGYGADVLAGRVRSEEETYDDWAAARAEMAILRQRIYSAIEAIRTLKMNTAGLEASNKQYQRSLAVQRDRRDRLRREVAELEAAKKRA
jgi:FtsZ-binding cell division protein ZapB